MINGTPLRPSCSKADNDLRTVSDQLRHAYISTTTDMYVGKILEPQKKAANAMDDFLGLGEQGKKNHLGIQDGREILEAIYNSDDLTALWLA